MADLLYTWLTPQGIIALGMVYTAVVGEINRRATKKLTHEMNSMRDAQVEMTARASDAEGEKRGIAIGVAQEKDRPTS